MNFLFQGMATCLAAAILFASAFDLCAFALLGPVQPWMQASNSVVVAGDIGGPMDIGSGYRWNVPVLTYGFDKSFLDYYGSNGVTAVQSAIQILNDLPPASQIVLTNYPFNSQQYNYLANAQSLYDLKSQALSLLVEHMGLTQPVRNIFVLKNWTPSFLTNPSSVPAWAYPFQDPWQDWAIPFFIVQRNFDPQTHTASTYVNDSLFFGYVASGNPNVMEISPSEPGASVNYSVGDFYFDYGTFDTGLTYDDVGGLSYLLSTNTVNYEILLPGVFGSGVNSNSFFNGAWRPGVDKITFLPQPVDSQSGAFLPTTNYFTDHYLTNGKVQTQQLARVISQPDFLFLVANQGGRTGTTNWINNASRNGNANGEGPGTIQPPVKIIFTKTTKSFANGNNRSDETAFFLPQTWASFDGSTNAPVIYPKMQTGTNQLTVSMWLSKADYLHGLTQTFEWASADVIGSQVAFQTSTNLVNWVNLFMVTNDGNDCIFYNHNPKSPSRFYRVIPQ